MLLFVLASAAWPFGADRTERPVSDRDFEAVVLQSDQPAVAYFWASWCPACRSFDPTFDKARERCGDRVRFVRIEGDLAPDAMRRYGVRGYPTVLRFHAGKRRADLNWGEQTARSLCRPGLGSFPKTLGKRVPSIRGIPIPLFRAPSRAER